MSLGAAGAAAAMMAQGFANAKKGENWHKRNKWKSKQRQAALKDKYKQKLNFKEGELLKLIHQQMRLSGLKSSHKKCPECKNLFSLITLIDIELDCCLRCKSFWFDRGELMDFSGLDKDVPSDDLVSRNSKYPCPICQSIMREYVYINPHNLLVDQCIEHGVYLENNEINRLIEIT